MVLSVGAISFSLALFQGDINKETKWPEEIDPDNSQITS